MGSSKKKPGNTHTTAQDNAENMPPSSVLVPTESVTNIPPHPLWLFIITFISALGGYLLTFARTVTLVDSGELILTSAKLGVAHPPGTPLYTILGFLFSKLPFGSVAARISFMSSVFAAVTAAMLSLIASEIDVALKESRHKTAIKGKGESKSKIKYTDPNATINTLTSLTHVFNWLMPISIGLTLAFSVTLWFYASVAEVYTLNIALLATIVYLMVRWHRQSSKNSSELWSILAAAGIYGLALGVHHVTILLTLPAFALLVWRTAGSSFFLSRGFVGCFLLALLGLAIYLYLPLAAARQPVLNWGNPNSWQRFYWHISAKQYQVNLFSTSVEEFTLQLSYFLKLIFRQFTPLGLAVAVVGLLALWRQQRSLCWLLVLIIIFDIAYSLIYNIAEDKDAYYLTTDLAMAIAVSAGTRLLYNWSLRRSKITTVAIVIVVATLPVANFAAHYVENNKRNYLIARDFVNNTLSSVESGGLLLTLDWQFYSPYLYMHHIENYRPDVTVVDVNLLRRSWYIEGYLMREYPEMMQACEAEKHAFLEDLTLFEQGLPYDTARINQRFIALIDAFIKFKLIHQSAFLTLPMEQGVATAYNWVPQGLTMRLYPDKNFHPESPNLELRGLLDNSVYLDEVAKGKVIRNYATMMANRGRYLAAAKQLDQALSYLRLSLQLDATFDRTYEFIGDVYAMQGKVADAIQSYQSALTINPGNSIAQQHLTALQSQKPSS